MSGQLRIPTALNVGRYPPVPIIEEAGWTSEPVYTQGASKEKSLPCPCQDSNLSSSPTTVTTLIELPWIHNIKTPKQNNTSHEFGI
jgi:hypothetical protein